MGQVLNNLLFDASLRCDHMINKIADGVNSEETEIQRVQKIIATCHAIRCKEILKKTYQFCECETSDDFANLPFGGDPRVAFGFRIKSHEIDLMLDAVIIKRLGAKKYSIEPIFFSVNRKLAAHERHLAILRTLLIEKVIGVRVAKASVFLLGTERPIRISVVARAVVQRALESLNAVAHGDRKKTLATVIPFCKQCPFEKTCLEELKARDDLSLLGGISKNEIKSNQSRGIFTVNQLSHSYRPRRRPEGAKPKYYAALRAMAMREKKIYIVHKPVVPAEKTDIFFDVEGLPDIDFYYLIGVHVRTSRGTKTYSFWSSGPEQERENWLAFIKLIGGLKQYRLFHYGSYEKTFFEKMRKRYRLADEDAKIFEDMRSKLSNVVSLIYGQIYFPTYTNGLKDIGAYLGTTWSQDANGLLSIAWRDAWSISERFEFRALIEKYNSDDCVALCIVVDFLRKVSISKEEAVVEGKQIGDGGDARLNTNYRWGNTSFLVPELEAINKCAYFDYQSSKIFFGQNRKRKQRIAGSRAKQKIRARINKTVVLEAPTRCPRCKSTETYRHGRYSRTLVDVRFTDGGIKRWIVKYIGLRRSCRRCRHVYVPPSYPRFVPLYGEGLTSLVVYLNIALRLTSGEIREYLHRVLGLSIAHSMVWRMKQTRAEYYKGTTKQLFRSMKKGHLLQVDETNVKVDRKGCYVWVFATLSEVVYLFAETRKGDILQANLKNFKGVLISDFFAAYDAVPCRQQKCLVHLIRDLNDDLFKNQLDEEFKALVVEFAILMNGIVATIDRWGLRAKYMKKHGRDVDRFYRRISRREFGSEVGLQYQKRFLKNRDRLFVFLEHDNVPWNNNYAENAIKTFAEFRRKFNKRFQPDGLREYLILLSLQHTCKLRGIDFLKFLLSGKRSLPQAGSFRE